MSRPIKVNKRIKPDKEDIIVKNKRVTNANIKANKTDAGGNFYVYDLFTNKGEIAALNRYVLKGIDQPFENLSEDEEKILNPTIIPDPNPDPNYDPEI